MFLSFCNFCLLVLLLVLFLPFYFLFSFSFYYYLDGLKAHAPFQLKSWPNSIQVKAHKTSNLQPKLGPNVPAKAGPDGPVGLVPLQADDSPLNVPLACFTHAWRSPFPRTRLVLAFSHAYVTELPESRLLAPHHASYCLHLVAPDSPLAGPL